MTLALSAKIGSNHATGTFTWGPTLSWQFPWQFTPQPTHEYYFPLARVEE